MRATNAYIASAGTAAVMLGASLCVFALLSAFVTFGSWPGTGSHTAVDQIVLNSIERPHAAEVTVRSDAVAIARRQAARTLAATTPAGPAVTQVTKPSSPGTAVPPRQPATAPASGGGAGGTLPNPVGTSAPDVATTTQQVQTHVEDVQLLVNQVIDQIIGGPAPAGSGGVVNGAGALLGG